MWYRFLKSFYSYLSHDFSNEKKGIVKSIASTLLVETVLKLIGLMSVLITYVFLGKSSFAEYSMFWLFLELGVIVSGVGVPFFVMTIQRQEPSVLIRTKIKWSTKVSFWSSMLISSIIYLVSLLCDYPFNRNLLLTFILLLPILVISNLRIATLQRFGSQLIGTVGLKLIVPSLVVVGLLALVLFAIEVTLIKVVLIAGIASVASFFVLLLLYELKFKRKFFKYDLTLVSSRWYLVALIGLGRDVLGFLLRRIDIILLFLLDVDGALLGLYIFLVYVVESLLLLKKVSTTCLSPILHKHLRSSNFHSVQIVLSKANLFINIFTLPAVIVVLFSVYLFGTYWQEIPLDSLFLFLGLMVVYALEVFVGPHKYILMVDGKGKSIIKWEFILLTIAIPLYYVIVSHFGLWGALGVKFFMMIIKELLFSILLRLKVGVFTTPFGKYLWK